MSAHLTRRAVLGGLAAAASVPLLGRIAHAAGWTVYDFPYRDDPQVRQGVQGIYAAATDDAWSVGRAGMKPVVGRWNGSSWRVVDTPAVGGTISGNSADDIWIGSGNQSMHWDGTSWTVTQLPPPPQDHLYLYGGKVVTGAAGSAWNLVALENIWGPGQPPAMYRVMRWTGSEWVVVPGPLGSNYSSFELRDLDVVGADDAWVVGTRVSQERAVVAQWVGGSWRDHVLPVAAGAYLYPEYVVATRPGDVWVSGREVLASGTSRGYLGRWNGMSWTRVAVPDTGYPYRLHDVGGVPLIRTSNGWFRWRGTGWQELPKPPVSDYYSEVRASFSAAPGGGIWVAGARKSGDKILPSTALYS